MAQITTAVGETGLREVTYGIKPGQRDTSVDESGPWIRIARQTAHVKFRGDVIDSSSEYEGDLDDFLALECSSQWFKDIQDLVLMQSDRAYQHVLFRIRYDEAFRGLNHRFILGELAKEFKSPRQIQYGQHLSLVTTPADLSKLDEEGKECAICTEAFDEDSSGDHASVALPCGQGSKSHILGKSCLTLWCQTQGPSRAQCPHCRHLIFSDSSVVKSLKFGTKLTDAKAYVDDSRFTEYENFERSCADLDRTLAAHDRTIIKLDEKMWAQEIFDYFFEPPPESASSTPLHLQPQLRPELKLFRREIERVFRVSGILSREIRNIETHILDCCIASYQFEIASLGANTKLRRLGRYRSGEDLDGLDTATFGDKHRLDPFWAPMGLVEFVKKAVNRSLRFLTVRRCGDECAREQDGLHHHGRRMYYKQAEVTETTDATE